MIDIFQCSSCSRQSDLDEAVCRACIDREIDREDKRSFEQGAKEARAEVAGSFTAKVREWVDRKRLIGQLPADSATALDELIDDLEKRS